MTRSTPPLPPRRRLALTRALLLCTLAVAALLTSGCVSKITGNEGNLTFQYAADDDLLDFNKAIAIGAKLDLTVRTAGAEEAVDLTDATTQKPAVLKVAAFSGHTLTVEGVGEGNTLVEVTAKKADGTTVTDSVNMRAAKAEVLKMRHYCTSETTGHYLVNSQALLPFELERKNGESVIGYGYYPVSISPATGATHNTTNKAQVHLWLDTGKTPTVVTLQSDIDATTLKMQLHEESEIDGALLDGGKAAAQAFVGLNHYALVRPTIAGAPVCQANADFEAEATTEETCTVKALKAKRTGADVETGWGWVEIQGKKAGKCNFNVSYPKADGGKGLVVPLEVAILEVVGG